MNDDSGQFNDNDEPEEAEQPATPVTPEPAKPELTRDMIKRRCKARHGIDADELDTLFPKDEDLREFYYNTVLKAGTMEQPALADEEEETEQEDDYKLSADERATVAGMKIDQQREERRARKKKAAVVKQQVQAEKREFEEINQTVAPEARVTYAEAKRAMRALLDKTKTTKKKE